MNSQWARPTRTATTDLSKTHGLKRSCPGDPLAVLQPLSPPDFALPQPAPTRADQSGNLRRCAELLEYFGDGLDPKIEIAIQTALRQFEAQGAEIIEISLPSSKHAIPAYYVIAPAEASANLSRYDGVRYGYRCETPVDLADLYKRSRSEGFGDEVKQRIIVGSFALSAGYYDAYYKKAQQIRRLIKNDFAQAFEQVDLIIGPTTPSTAFNLGEKTSDPISMYLQDIYTITSNLAGLPAGSFPVGMEAGLPFGLQIIGNYFDEGRILNLAHQFQLESDWHRLTPEATA